jgi:hypothetical protein
MYGIDEWTHAYRKMRARKIELDARRVAASNQMMQSQQEAQFLIGALSDLKYYHDTWADKGTYTGPLDWKKA